MMYPEELNLIVLAFISVVQSCINNARNRIFIFLCIGHLLSQTPQRKCELQVVCQVMLQRKFQQSDVIKMN